MSAYLWIEQGLNSGARQALDATTVIAGRDAECALHLPGPFISRRQFQIEPKDGAFVLENLAATHVTLLNGLEEPGRIPLEHDDVIEVGTTRIRFRVEAPASQSPPEVIGTSWQTARLREQIAQLATQSTPVLLRGDLGVGKTLVARAIHAASGRPSFVAFDATMAEAFSSPEEKRTLFIDDIDELSAENQATFLGLLSKSTNIRIITATSREFPATYDRELAQRLTAVRLELTPLCARKDDIADLARAILARYEGTTGAITLTPAAIEVLRAHPWPGNVSELRAVIERAVILNPGTELDADAINLEPTIADGELPRELASRALTVTNGSHRRAAAALSVSRSKLQASIASNLP